MEALEIIMQYIQNLGFPIAIVVYLLYRESKQGEAFRQTIDRNSDLIQQLLLVMKGGASIDKR